MKSNAFSRFSSNSIFASLVVLSALLSSSNTFAQSPVNFTGIWILDTSKSDDFYKSFDVNYSISQTLTAFTVKQTLTHKSSKEALIKEYAFTLDGKVTSIKKGNKTEMNSVQWSAGKDTLITKNTAKYGNQEVGFTETYSLSKNGLVLTAQKSDIIPGALSVKQVFTKKQ